MTSIAAGISKLAEILHLGCTRPLLSNFCMSNHVQIIMSHLMKGSIDNKNNFLTAVTADLCRLFPFNLFTRDQVHRIKMVSQ